MPLFSQPLCIVDVETTGSRAASDRIIEIGIIRVEHGEITETFSSLINPHVPLAPFIRSLTGITDHALQKAPMFEDILPKVLKLTDEALFIAHNAPFDYQFVRNELRREGIPFTPSQLCSARLSRALFPQFHHHNLDSIIARYGLNVAHRHRALDDAHAVHSFLKIIENTIEHAKITAAVSHLIKRTRIPYHLEKTIHAIPDTSGVYTFRSSEGAPLYIGKSVKLQTRIRSHFSLSANEEHNAPWIQSVSSVEYQEYPGELSALLGEAQKIKTEQPLHNRMLRNRTHLVLACIHRDSYGFDCVIYEKTEGIPLELMPSVAGIFPSVKNAKTFFRKIQKDFSLCTIKLGLERGTGACFHRKINQCKGACELSESPKLYNARFSLAVLPTRIKPWPFQGAIIITETDSQGRGVHIEVDKWCIVKTVSFDEYETIETQPHTLTFDRDVYQILQKMLYNKKRHTSMQITDKKRFKSHSGSG